MEFRENSIKPIFMQVGDWIEDEILKDNILEGDKIFSQVEFAKVFNINPLTAGKGVALLESRGVLEKRRGLGMFVSENAKSLIYNYRKNSNLTSIIDDLINEVTMLNMNYNTLIDIIKQRLVKETDND